MTPACHLNLSNWRLGMNEVKNRIDGESKGAESEEWVPLSVREARRAQRTLDNLWPYVWMNLVSMILLFSALAIACYRVGVQSCH
jgi:hypothetical protein